MIRLAGQCVQGLDEFMLRLGHLKVLCNVAAEVGGPRHRIGRVAAEVLTASTEIPDGMREQAAEYLSSKRFCPIAGKGEIQDESYRTRFRYPDLVLEKIDDQVSVRTFDASEANVRIWWQDLCLSHQDVPSKVGAITATAKEGSKTGLSHIFDWAEHCELLSRSGQSSSEGCLAAKLGGNTANEFWTSNPYILGNEKLILAFAIFSADMDVFSRFIVNLSKCTFPLRKRDAAQVFARTITEMVNESDESGYTTARQRYRHADMLRDLERTTKRKDVALGSTSTAWHRTSSRMETYVDLGLLTKSQKNPLEKFEYTYYSTDRLAAAAETIASSQEPTEWLEEHLVSVLMGVDQRANPTLGEIKQVLPMVIGAINSPAPSLSLDALAVGCTTLLCDQEQFAALGDVRALLESLARDEPDIARLSRGTSGERAEFISIDVRRLQQ